MYKYNAFGYTIESEYTIPQVPEPPGDSKVDVRIVKADLSIYKIAEIEFASNATTMMLNIPDLADFRVVDGNLIQVDTFSGYSESRLSVFLLGSCMGAIMHQRGELLIHGSCVTDGEHSILISGASGAGKSTTAAEFLARGWKLLTDDVTKIVNIPDTPMVQSSYPSQKLWADSLNRHEHDAKDVHSLYSRNDEEKYGLSVQDSFYDGQAPLTLIVRLVPANTTAFFPMKGIIMADELMKNTYRRYMIAEENRQRHFQQCITLSTKVRMCMIYRESNVDTMELVYNMIINYLKEKE